MAADPATFALATSSQPPLVIGPGTPPIRARSPSPSPSALPSVLDYPDILDPRSGYWLFDRGSNYGYSARGTKGGSFSLSGPAPDWALGGRAVPSLEFDFITSKDPTAEQSGEAAGGGGSFAAPKCKPNTPSQQWTLSPNAKPGGGPQPTVLKSVADKGCWEISGCSTGDGASVDTGFGCKALPKPGGGSGCDGNMAWTLDPNGTIASVMDGKCLQVSAGAGSVVNVAACTGHPSQKFKLRPVGGGGGGGVFTVTQAGGLCVDNQAVHPIDPKPAPPSPPPPPPPPAPDPMPSPSTELNATLYPGMLSLTGVAGGGRSKLAVAVDLVHVSANVSLLRLTATNPAGAPPVSGLRLRLGGTAVNLTAAAAGAGSGGGVDFSLPVNTGYKCFDPAVYSTGALRLAAAAAATAAFETPRGGAGTSEDSEQLPLDWKVTVDPEGGAFTATSAPLAVAAAGRLVAFAAIATVAAPVAAPELAAVLATAAAGEAAMSTTAARWDGYLASVLGAAAGAGGLAPPVSSWLAVKAVMTLIGNWRVVPGVGEGVLPNYSEYASGMWSWDTYKQAVGMVLWAPELAKNQLRLLVHGRDYQAGLAHIPDKVDRCGHGGGCAGKPPLLSWSVWGVYNHTGDTAFLKEMYPIIDSFHR
jgi:hypothetical protein